MLTEFQEKRIASLSWWNKLDTDVKVELCKQYFDDRVLYSLTGREIQIIWESQK